MKKLILCVMVMISITMAAQDFKTHTIQRGETIESIAAKYQVSVDAIKKANPNAGDVFYVGMKLKIPAAPVAPFAPVTTTKQNTTEESSTFISTIENEYPKTDGNYSSSNTQTVQESSEIVDKSEEESPWRLAFRIGIAFFKTYKSGSLKDGDYKSNNNYGYEAMLGIQYCPLDYLFFSSGLGYYETSSTSSVSSVTKAYGIDRSEVKARNIYLPIEVGGYYPIVKDKFAMIAETGISLLYALGGYYKYGDEKVSFSKFESDYNGDIERFGAFYRISGGVELWGFRIMAYYAFPLTGKSVNVIKDEKFWGITFGWAIKI